MKLYYLFRGRGHINSYPTLVEKDKFEVLEKVVNNMQKIQKAKIMKK